MTSSEESQPLLPAGDGARVKSYSAPGCPRAAAGLSYSWRRLHVFGDEASAASTWRGRFWPRSDRRRHQGWGRHLLRDVSGEARPGELLCVLGASGAGKTTLLDALAMRGAGARVEAGQRLLAGRAATPQALRALSAYVRQQDLFVGALTVREHLVFHAMLRMDREIPYEQRMRRVNDVISEFSLSACQDVVIGIPGRIKGISGGERKRLAFASEVLTDPPLMFCDEPTSGLDSFMALTVLSTLKRMAAKGKTVVATVHQPSSEMYALFDRLLLLAEGRVAFQGTPAEALEFFASLGAPCPEGFNPADFFMQLLAVVPEDEVRSRHQVELLGDAFHETPAGKALAGEEGVVLAGGSGGAAVCAQESPSAAAEQCERLVEERSPSPYKASWCAQFRVVLWRSWLSVIKEPVLIKMRMLQTIMLSLMIGTVFFGQTTDQAGVMNMNGAIILFMTNMTFQNVFAVITVFSDELAVFLREHLNGMYRVDVYFLSKTLAELPVFAAIPCLFTAIFYYMVGLNPEPSRFFIAMLIAALVTGVTTSFGYLLSALSPSTAVAMSMGAPAIFPFLLFGGFFINVGRLVVQQLTMPQVRAGGAGLVHVAVVVPVRQRGHVHQPVGGRPAHRLLHRRQRHLPLHRTHRARHVRLQGGRLDVRHVGAGVPGGELPAAGAAHPGAEGAARLSLRGGDTGPPPHCLLALSLASPLPHMWTAAF